jgi:signal peptide peptidase SppA
MSFEFLSLRIFGKPHMISQAKAAEIAAVIMPRFQGVEVTEKQQAALGDPPPRKENEGGYIRYESGVAVMPVHGTLVHRSGFMDANSGLTSYTRLDDALGRAIADPLVRGVILELDSHGGEVDGVFELADKIQAAASIKPVWAMANESAFSAGYLLASATSRVYLTRTAGVGSIGVRAAHLDQSKAEDAAGLTYTEIYAGARKIDGTPHKPLSKKAHQVIQKMVDETYALFVDTVADYRDLEPQAVRDTEAGLFFGQEAIETGLADQIAGLDQVIDEMEVFLNAKQGGGTVGGAPASTPLSASNHESQAKGNGMFDRKKAKRQAQAAANEAHKAEAEPVVSEVIEGPSQDTLDAAFDDGFQQGLRQAADILALPQAEGRTASAAQCIGLGLNVDQAKKFLETVPAATLQAEPLGEFQQAMAALGNPDLGPGEESGTAGDLANDPTALAKRMQVMQEGRN